MLNLPGDPGDKPRLKRPCVSAPGCASRLFSKLPLGCHGHARGLKRCRVGDGRGIAPGDPCNAADAVCKGDGDGGVGEGNPVRRRRTDARNA
jgi:hypothetical protein